MPEEERGRAGSVKPGIWGQSVGMWPHDGHQYFSPEACIIIAWSYKLCWFTAVIPAIKKLLFLTSQERWENKVIFKNSVWVYCFIVNECVQDYGLTIFVHVLICMSKWFSTVYQCVRNLTSCLLHPNLATSLEILSVFHYNLLTSYWLPANLFYMSSIKERDIFSDKKESELVRYISMLKNQDCFVIYRNL